MESYAFAIDERPQRIWDWELKDKNLQFLRGIDPDYFLHIADVNAEILAKGKDHRAAVAIRLAYSHALETFMAFSGAAFQAPRCPLGWMLRYGNEDLRNVVRKITQGCLSHARLSSLTTWESLAIQIVEKSSVPGEQKQVVATDFARLWRRLALDFLDRDQELEYNSLKHGMRVRTGGFSLRIGQETDAGERPPDKAMKMVGSSDYGTSYFVIEKPAVGKIDFRPRSFSRNWIPENFFHGLELLAASLGNIVSYLRALGSDDSELPFRRPDDLAGFDAPWLLNPGVTSFNFDYNVRAEDIDASTKESVFDEIKHLTNEGPRSDLPKA